MQQEVDALLFLEIKTVSSPPLVLFRIFGSLGSETDVMDDTVPPVNC